MKFEKIKFKQFNNAGIGLIPVEFKDSIPFEVKRVYTITADKNAKTNEHCHINEQEVFMLVSGGAVMLIDKGAGKEEIPLTEPGEAVCVPNYVWHGFMKFEEGSVVLALSSTNYKADRSDYIEDYNEYLKIRDEKLKI